MTNQRPPSSDLSYFFRANWGRLEVEGAPGFWIPGSAVWKLGWGEGCKAHWLGRLHNCLPFILIFPLSFPVPTFPYLFSCSASQSSKCFLFYFAKKFCFLCFMFCSLNQILRPNFPKLSDSASALLATIKFFSRRNSASSFNIKSISPPPMATVLTLHSILPYLPHSSR